MHTSTLRERGKGQRRDRRWREREEAVIEGWGTGGPGYERARERHSGEEEFTERRGRCAGPTGTTVRRERRSEEEGWEGVEF